MFSSLPDSPTSDVSTWKPLPVSTISHSAHAHTQPQENYTLSKDPHLLSLISNTAPLTLSPAHIRLGLHIGAARDERLHHLDMALTSSGV
jgi:hypothetical protein